MRHGFASGCRRLPVLLLLVASALAAGESATGVRVTWDFGGPELDGWAPTRHVQPLAVRDGALQVTTCGDDPGVQVSLPAFVPEPGDWVEIRLRASSTGNAQLFWFPQAEPAAVGVADFHVPKADAWVTLAVFPAWGRSGPLCRLRLDVYHFGGGCCFEVDRVAVRAATGVAVPVPAGGWRFAGPAANARWADWRPTAEAELFLSPLLTASVVLGDWATVQVRARRDAVPALIWFDAATGDSGRLPFALRGDGVGRVVNLQLAGAPAWSGRPARVGLEVPLIVQDSVEVEALSFGPAPAGPAELAVGYFGLERAQPRAGRPVTLLAVVENRGGSASAESALRLDLGPGLAAVAGQEATRALPALAPGERCRLRWEVQANAAGPAAARLQVAGPEPRLLASAAPSFLAPRAVVPADYVPEPRPIRTDTEVFMFYFPGWEAPAKWVPIRDQAPERRPLLGWYDEALPECVDWQIKWATENGISGFVLDWYWNRGQRQLGHWLEAYRQARYRDRLKLFLLWCDHGGHDVQKPEDLGPIVRYWLDRVFVLPGYYRLDGRPVVALFEPDVLRSRLGGSAGVRAAFELAQAEARRAGYPGIAFLSGNNNCPAEQAPLLAAEGYTGVTTYHEPGLDYHDCPNQQMRSYAKEVQTAPCQWQAHLTAHSGLRYFPVVDSGWDSRPWHGLAAPVVHGRSVAGFEEWLRQGRAFCRQHGIPLLVLGPANEWGEGSYLEPCTEFGFGMYEAVRRTFAVGAAADWPENLSPEDVGRGPYDLPEPLPRRQWDFADGPQGWSAASGCTVTVQDGRLCVRSVNDDPVLVCATDFPAAAVGQWVVRLSCSGGTGKTNYAQLFWAADGGAISGTCVVGFVFADSPEPREYRVDLAAHPRWRGRIRQLRFDPCCEPDLTVRVEAMRVEPAGR